MHSGGVTQMKNNLIAFLIGLLFVGGLMAGCSNSSDEASGGGTGAGTDSGAGQTEPEKPVVDTDAGNSTDTGTADTGTTDTGTIDSGTAGSGTTDSGTTDTGSSGKTEGGGGTGM